MAKEGISLEKYIERLRAGEMLCVCFMRAAGHGTHRNKNIGSATDQPVSQPLLSRCICAEVKSHYFRETNKQWRCQFVNQFFLYAHAHSSAPMSLPVDFS
jgi:hypothetical protein